MGIWIGDVIGVGSGIGIGITGSNGSPPGTTPGESVRAASILGERGGPARGLFGRVIPAAISDAARAPARTDPALLMAPATEFIMEPTTEPPETEGGSGTRAARVDCEGRLVLTLERGDVG